jgi:ABC-type uncharacterized transport system involved in gliding motility auxiliary subunit
MARIRLARLFTCLGYAGFIIIVATAIAYSAIPAAQRYTWAGWIVGLVCLVVYVVGSFDTIRDYFKRRSARHGVNALILILLVLGILAFVEAISARHNARFDLTAIKRFTLSGQTSKILRNLEKPVRITGFYQEASPQAQEARDLLDQYAYVSPKFSFKFVDPDRFPGEARRYKITAYGTLVLESETREEKITQATEQELTNALLRVMRKGEKVVYFTNGHDEKPTENYGKDGYSEVKKAIDDQNYVVRDLLLMRAQEVPADASVLIIAGPKKAFFPEEISTIRRYIDQGGHLLLLIDPGTDAGLGEFLKSCGIELGQDMIVDKLSRLFGADYLTPIVSQYAGYHPITENFRAASFFPLARSVSVAQVLPEQVENTELAKTGPSSWAETDLVTLKKGDASFDNQKDTMGPVPVAVVSTIQHETKESDSGQTEETLQGPDDSKDGPRPARIVVFGDSDFAGNTYLNLSGNRDLFMNTLSWLAEEEDLIAIRPKKRESQPVVLSYAQGRAIFWASVVLLPGGVLIIGIVLLRWRRTS